MIDHWAAHQLKVKAERAFGLSTADSLVLYAAELRKRGLPVVFTLNHLAKICSVAYPFLHATVARRRISSNYRLFFVRKRSGGKRCIHVPCPRLMKVQRFIAKEILNKVPPSPHSYAYHSNGGVVKCASPHIDRDWLIKFDLRDFFYSIDERDVYRVFRGLGYKSLLSFELARLCTTTFLPFPDGDRIISRSGDVAFHSLLGVGLPYKRIQSRGVLPQGAPTSPMLSNLCSMKMDSDIADYCANNGFVYSRYADDIAISGMGDLSGPLARSIRQNVVHLIHDNGYYENRAKFVVIRKGGRFQLHGLLIDEGRVRLSKAMYRRVDRLLYCVEKFGYENVANHEGFTSQYGLFKHLDGLIAYTQSVDEQAGSRFRSWFRRLIPREFALL